MGKTNGIGHSKETLYKSEIIDEITDLHFSIVRHIWLNGKNKQMFPFYYLDLYCGDGVNPDDGNPSASLCLVQKLCEQQFDFEARLIDKGKNEDGKLHVDSMRERLSMDEAGRVRLYPGNALKLAPAILEALTGQPLGLIFIDPNGVKDLPTLLPRLAGIRQTQRMDLLFHIGANHINRARACEALPSYQWHLTDILALTEKERGFIKRSPAGQWHRWLYVLMTNAPANTMRQWATKGWYDLNGDIGQQILLHHNYTKQELEEMNQAPLFKDRSDDESDED